MCTIAAPSSRQATAVSTISAGVIGTYGFCSFVVRVPVSATDTMSGSTLVIAPFDWSYYCLCGRGLVVVLTATRRSSLAISCDGVTRLADAALPTRHGEFRIEIVRVDGLAQEVVVLRLGETDGRAATLVRIQSECLTGEVFGSLRCDCAAQLSASLARI